MQKIALISGLAAPIVALAVVAATRSPANEPHHEAQEVRAETGAAPEPTPDSTYDSDADADDPAGATGDGSLGLPRRGVAESIGSSRPVALSRLLDRATLEARGKSGPASPATWAATAFNNDAWPGALRRELIAFLRGDAAANERDLFDEADARTIARIQAGSGAEADGRLTESTLAVLFATGFRFSTRLPSREVELDFYPGEIEDLDAWAKEIREKVIGQGGSFRDIDPPDGEGRIYVRVDGRTVAAYRARGGPPAMIADTNGHIALPTRPGTYTLGWAHARVTSAWYNSQIPWGAEIRQVEGGYQYRRPRGVRWWWATEHEGATLKKPYVPTDFDDLPRVWRDGENILIWTKNDFGPLAWNLVNSDQYVHTTPDAERDAEKGGEVASFIVSHGCVHITPGERDDMVARGYLRKDVRFIVRRVEDHLLPSGARQLALRPKREAPPPARPAR